MRRLAVLLTASAALILSPLRANNLLEEVRRLPESNPYRAALERYTALPAEERERLEAWASPADESAMSIVLSAPKKPWSMNSRTP